MKPTKTVWTCLSCNGTHDQESQALSCGTPKVCYTCHNPILSGSLCGPCRVQGRTSMEKSLYASASKIAYMEYRQPWLFWSGAGVGGEFFPNRTALEEYCFERGFPVPTWVWGCSDCDFFIDASSALSNASIQVQGGLETLLESQDIKDLQTVLDGWAKSRKLRTYDVDYSTVVIIDKTRYGEASFLTN